MFVIEMLAFAFVAIGLFQTGSAAPQLEVRGGSVCSSGIYGELVPFLDQFPIALEYCSAVFPVKCTSAPLGKRAAARSTTTKSSSTTTTRSSTTTPTGNRPATTTKSPSTTKTSCTTTTRSTTTTPKGTTPATTTKSPSATTKPSTTTTISSQNSQASAWSACQKQPWDVISTLCSCIETPKACPTTSKSATTATTTASTMPSTTATTTASSSTTTTTTTSPPPVATGPVKCSNAECSTGSYDPACGPGCLCMPDYSTHQGYCTDGDTSYLGCRSDGDCPPGQYCLDGCGQGFCYNVEDS